VQVVISGAGIAGLSLALRLHQNGLVPIVIERSPNLRADGYMLGLSDSGYDAAEHMDIADTLKAAQYSPRHLLYVTSDGRARFALQGRALEVLVGERQLNLMRGDIERVLYERVHDALDIRFGRSLAALKQNGTKMLATLDDDTTLEADLVVGADGLHSKVRALAFGPEEQFVSFLGARVGAFIFERSLLRGIDPNETYPSPRSAAPPASPPSGESDLSPSSSINASASVSSIRLKRNSDMFSPERTGSGALIEPRSRMR
jgi:2-polyprenyl-6-methoxyphenol hydroxylase-like FAD-dependent oxidoreductase